MVRKIYFPLFILFFGLIFLQFNLFGKESSESSKDTKEETKFAVLPEIELTPKEIEDVSIFLVTWTNGLFQDLLDSPYFSQNIRRVLLNDFFRDISQKNNSFLMYPKFKQLPRELVFEWFFLPIVGELIEVMKRNQGEDLMMKAKDGLIQALLYYETLRDVENRKVNFCVLDSQSSHLIQLIFHPEKREELKQRIIAGEMPMVHWFDILIAKQLYHELERGRTRDVFEGFIDEKDQLRLLGEIEQNPKLQFLLTDEVKVVRRLHETKEEAARRMLDDVLGLTDVEELWSSRESSQWVQRILDGLKISDPKLRLSLKIQAIQEMMGKQRDLKFMRGTLKMKSPL